MRDIKRTAGQKIHQKNWRTIEPIINVRVHDMITDKLTFHTGLIRQIKSTSAILVDEFCE